MTTRDDGNGTGRVMMRDDGNRTGRVTMRDDRNRTVRVTTRDDGNWTGRVTKRRERGQHHQPHQRKHPLPSTHPCHCEPLLAWGIVGANGDNKDRRCGPKRRYHLLGCRFIIFLIFSFLSFLFLQTNVFRF
jgi:hypothetical protein